MNQKSNKRLYYAALQISANQNQKRPKEKKLLDEILDPRKALTEYLTLWILIPTVLGSIWQVLRLITISPGLINFFSITQAGSDGMRLLIHFLFLFFLPMYFARKLAFKYRKNINPRFRATAYFIILGIISAEFIIRNHTEPGELSNIPFDMQYFFFLFFNLFFDSNFTEKWEILFRKIVNFIVFGFALFNVIETTANYKETIIIDNYKIIKEKYGDSSKILYNNDKYFFIETTKPNSTQRIINIEKFDSIF